MPRQYPSRFGPPSVDDSTFAATLTTSKGNQQSRQRLGPRLGQPLNDALHIPASILFPEMWTGSHPDRPRLFKPLQLPQPPTQATPVDISTGPEQWRGYHPDSPTKFGRGRQIGLPPEWVFIPEPFSIDMITMNRPLRPMLFRARYSRVVVQPPWPNAITGPVCLTTATGEAVTLSVAQALAPSPTVVLSTPKLSVTLFKC